MNDSVLRWCEDGHTWIDQGDGTVSPSWGLGGTHMPIEDALRCPEPMRNDDDEIWCEDCGEWKASIADCIQGLSFSPWENKKWCRSPIAACLKPAIGGNAWRDQYLPFDDTCWCAWWVRKDGAWLLTFHSGCSHRMWSTRYECIDVNTGDELDVDRTWQARRARLEEYPAFLRDRWWKTSKGKLIGCWSTLAPGGAGWLIDRKLVQSWVHDAVRAHVATVGQQLVLDVA